MGNNLVVLLSTYNAGNYLLELIESLNKQIYKNFDIIIRDDCSTIIERENLIKISQQHKNIQLHIGTQNLGVILSYSKLLELALEQKYEYIMFADQDDYWLPGKIEKTLNLMKKTENISYDSPILVHTDLIVTNQTLAIIDRSFLKYQKLSPRASDFERLLMQNITTGCSMMINRKLAEKATPIPEGVIMHDWWIALVCSIFGHITFLDEGTLYYRQHGGNLIGAKKYDVFRLIKKVLKDRNNPLIVNSRQALIFKKNYGAELDRETINTIDTLILIGNIPKWKRPIVLINHKLIKNGVLRNIGLWIKLLIMKR
ncbi:glycosyltransferase family 2 protein [Paenibacillus planticolens]|nr:glycosyltransferase family 2 protein [Paenibacillus planticolens]